MNKPNENIIQRFYENQSSEDEYRLVRKYLNSLSEDELNLFMDSHIDKLENNKVKTNISYKPNFKTLQNIIEQKKNTKIVARKKTFYSIAATIILFFVAGFSFYYFLNSEIPQKIKWNEKVTKIGQKSIITLLDGTRIVLNADSKLRYPIKFGKDQRVVQLEGEAYFEVSHNPKKPFIVRAGDVVTTVLGTKFNIKAYPQEEDIKVALVKGKVKVTKDNKRNSKEVILNPHQQIIYNKKDKTENIVTFNTRKTIGWRNNVLVFENERLEDVLITLERAFGIELEIAEEISRNRRISANFDDESFWGIINVVKYLTALNTKPISENNELRKIIFTKNK